MPSAHRFIMRSETFFVLLGCAALKPALKVVDQFLCDQCHRAGGILFVIGRGRDFRCRVFFAGVRLVRLPTPWPACKPFTLCFCIIVAVDVVVSHTVVATHAQDVVQRRGRGLIVAKIVIRKYACNFVIFDLIVHLILAPLRWQRSPP